MSTFFEDDRVSIRNDSVDTQPVSPSVIVRSLERKQSRGMNYFVISPGNQWKVAFDVVVALAIVLFSISTPVNLAFELRHCSHK